MEPLCVIRGLSKTGLAPMQAGCTLEMGRFCETNQIRMLHCGIGLIYC